VVLFSAFWYERPAKILRQTRAWFPTTGRPLSKLLCLMLGGNPLRFNSRSRSRIITIALAGLVMIAPSFVFARPVDYGGYRPNYQGYGANTPGGRGGAVCRVRSLSDTASPAVPGTLRYCVETSSGPRFVIFEISGTIHLVQGPLFVRSPYITIAGQTAPSPGILIRGPGLIVDTHDVVVQHVRVRVGNLPNEPIAMWLRDDAHNVVLDHVSLSWSVWTALVVAAQTPGHSPGDVTIIDSMIEESLACSGVNTRVPCDPNSYPAEGFSNSRAMIIGDLWKDAVKNVTLLRNVIANNNDRQPEIGGRTHTFLVNNLIFNPSQTPMSALFYSDPTGQGPFLSVAQGNILIPGSTTPGTDGYVPPEYPEEGALTMVRVHPTVDPNSRIYLDGNYYERDCGGTACLASPAAQWMLARDYMWDWLGVSIRATTPPLAINNLALSSALPYAEVEAYLEANAGARPLDRDAVDARIIDEITTRTGSVPNLPSDKRSAGTAADGFPKLAVNRRALTVPNSPNVVADAVGRTRIEMWLEGFCREVEPATQH
jgi:hypothetical protein